MVARSPSAELMHLVNGYQVSQAIRVVAALGIADLLRDGPRGSDDLASTAGVHAGSLYRLLRALAAVDVFREEADRRFSLTPMGQCLTSDADRPVGPWAEYVGRPYHWSAWGDLLHSVRTGDSAFHHAHGTDPFEYRSRHPEEGAVFDRAMTALSRRVVKATVAAHDFSRYGRVVDVGGGHGTMLAAVLAAHPRMMGVLFERPEVIAQAGPVLEAAGVADRCELVGGNFFEDVPGGGDAYLLKAVLHDWDDPEAEAILRTCRRAVGPKGRIVVVERLVAPPNEEPDTKFGDLNMMAMTGGRERTQDEFAALLAAAGFRLAEIVRTGTPVRVIEAVPV